MPKISELFTLQMGKTPARANLTYWNNGDNDWVSISDLSSFGKYVGATKETISDDAVRESGIKSVPANTVLMSFKLSIGKTAITTRPTYTNEAIMAFIPKAGGHILPDYFYHFCSGHNWTSDSNRAAMGTTLNKATLSDMVISIPPMDEQRKIAAVLDNVSELIALRQQQLQELDNLVKSRFIEMFGDPQRNPFGYKKKAIRETCTITTGNTPSRAFPEYYGNYIEWIKTDNIVTGMLNPTNAVEYLSIKGMEVGRTVDTDSILMACIAGSIASIGRICVTNRKVAFNQQINAIVPSQYDTLFLYVLLLISKEYLVKDINMALKGILSKSKLEEKEFIVPPMEEQLSFSTFVKQIDKSKLAVRESLAELETLRNSLMQQYFS